MSTEPLRERIRQFVLQNFIFDENGGVGDDQSLIRSGVMDSTGILELIVFVEEEFNVRFSDNELVEENFDTINLLAAILEKKMETPSSTSAGGIQGR